MLKPRTKTSGPRALLYKFDIETYYTPATAPPGHAPTREGL